MGLLSDYLDWVRGSYEQYDQAIQDQDLGVGADYEAITGEPFGPHVAVTGVIGVASGRIWVGPMAHLVYHALEKVYSGIADSVFVDDVVSEGDNTFDDVIDWIGQPVVPGVTRGDVVIAGASAARRSWIVRQKRLKGRCTSRNWRGKQCKLYRGHSTLATSQLGDHDY